MYCTCLHASCLALCVCLGPRDEPSNDWFLNLFGESASITSHGRLPGMVPADLCYFDGLMRSQHFFLCFVAIFGMIGTGLVLS